MLKDARRVTSMVTVFSSLLFAPSIEAQTMTSPQTVSGDVAMDIGSVPAKQRTTDNAQIRAFTVNIPEA